MSAQLGQGQQTCQLCGNTVPPNALYCPSCGARQTPVAASAEEEAQSFEDAIASVLGDETGNVPPTSQPQPDEPEYAPPFEPVSASPPPPPQAWTAPQQAEPSGWGTTLPPVQSAPSGRSRTLWIVLAIFGFITFCCCGVFFLSVAVT